jgi:hypothetical protein
VLLRCGLFFGKCRVHPVRVDAREYKLFRFCVQHINEALGELNGGFGGISATNDSKCFDVALGCNPASGSELWTGLLFDEIKRLAPARAAGHYVRNNGLNRITRHVIAVATKKQPSLAPRLVMGACPKAVLAHAPISESARAYHFAARFLSTLSPVLRVVDEISIFHRPTSSASGSPHRFFDRAHRAGASGFLTLQGPRKERSPGLKDRSFSHRKTDSSASISIAVPSIPIPSIPVSISVSDATSPSIPVTVATVSVPNLICQVGVL